MRHSSIDSMVSSVFSVRATKSAAGWLTATWFLALAPLATVQAAPQTTTAPAPPFEARLGKYVATIEGLNEPAAAVIDEDDTIYIVDSGQHCVVVATRDGKIVRRFGARGESPGQLLNPQGIALDADRNLIVADTGNHRLQRFSREGQPLGTWGQRGRAAGEFFAPTGLALAADELFVADRGNDRIQVLDATSGQPRRALSAQPGAAGELLREPLSVALSADGELFVSDAHAPRVQRFSKTGEPLASWGEYGALPGFLGTPLMVTTRGEHLYVTDVMNHRVQVQRIRDWAVLYDWGVHVVEPRQGQGRIHYPTSAAVAPREDFVVVCEAWEGRCQIFVRMSGPQDDISYLRLGMEQAAAHYGQRVSSAGDFLAMTEPETHQVQIFNTSRSEPINITTLGGYGAKFGQFVHPRDVDLAADGTLWVVDAGNRRLVRYQLKLDSQAELAYSLLISRLVKSVPFDVLEKSVPRERLGWPLRIDALERTADAALLAVDSRNAIVLEFDARLACVRVLGGPGDASAALRRPVDLAVSGAEVLVLDAQARRVECFARSGEHRRGFAVCEADEPTGEPAGIVARDAALFVSDRGLHRLSKYDAAGARLARWGKPGLGAGEFHRPAGMTIDARGRLLVIDFGNHRGQYFDLSGEFQSVFGARWYVRPALRARPR